MNNLNDAVSKLSSFFGVELRAELISRYPVDIEIRFEGVSDTEFMFFRVSREWASTTISLVPDIFGLNSWNMIGLELARNAEKLEKYIENRGDSASEVRLVLDGSLIQNFQTLSDESKFDWSFEADILTSDSLIGDGLVSDSEYELVKFALEIFVPFLPIKFEAFKGPDEVVGFPEGASTLVKVNKYERNAKNRKACISHYGSVCQVCGFDFSLNYGQIGDGFIIVHHIVPVSKIGPDYIVDPINDLIPLCANCHAIIHRQDPPLTLSELKSMIENPTK